MTHKNDAERYQTLSSTQELLRGVEDASDAFLLEDILAEYGDGPKPKEEVKAPAAAEEVKPAPKAAAPEAEGEASEKKPNPRRRPNHRRRKPQKSTGDGQ